MKSRPLKIQPASLQDLPFPALVCTEETRVLFAASSARRAFPRLRCRQFLSRTSGFVLQPGTVSLQELFGRPCFVCVSEILWEGETQFLLSVLEDFLSVQTKAFAHILKNQEFLFRRFDAALRTVLTGEPLLPEKEKEIRKLFHESGELAPYESVFLRFLKQCERKSRDPQRISLAHFLKKLAEKLKAAGFSLLIDCPPGPVIWLPFEDLALILLQILQFISRYEKENEVSLSVHTKSERVYLQLRFADRASLFDIYPTLLFEKEEREQANATFFLPLFGAISLCRDHRVGFSLYREGDVGVAELDFKALFALPELYLSAFSKDRELDLLVEEFFPRP